MLFELDGSKLEYSMLPNAAKIQNISQSYMLTGM